MGQLHAHAPTVSCQGLAGLVCTGVHTFWVLDAWLIGLPYRLAAAFCGAWLGSSDLMEGIHGRLLCWQQVSCDMWRAFEYGVCRGDNAV